MEIQMFGMTHEFIVNGEENVNGEEDQKLVISHT